MAQTWLRLAVGIMVVVAGSLLQGCALMEMAASMAKSFVETSCRSGAKARLQVTEQKWVNKINDLCNVAFEDSDDDGDAEKACLEQAGAVLEEDEEQLLDNYTEICAASFFNTSDSENHTDIMDHITQFFETMRPDVDLAEMLKGKLNATLEHIQTEHLSGDTGHETGNGNHTGNHAENHAGSEDAEDKEHTHGAENHAGSEDAEDKKNTHEPRHESRLFDADISIGHIGRPGGFMAACFAGMTLVVSGFVVVRRRDARHAHTEESQGALIEDGEQASTSC